MFNLATLPEYAPFMRMLERLIALSPNQYVAAQRKSPFYQAKHRKKAD